jgi:hypothetical protein
VRERAERHEFVCGEERAEVRTVHRRLGEHARYIVASHGVLLAYEKRYADRK